MTDPWNIVHKRMPLTKTYDLGEGRRIVVEIDRYMQYDRSVHRYTGSSFSGIESIYGEGVPDVAVEEFRAIWHDKEAADREAKLTALCGRLAAGGT